jgi:hypothetical protein
MTIESVFLTMMPSTVTVYIKSSRDAYSKPSFSASGTGVRARVQEDRPVTSGEVREVTESGTIYFYGNPTVSVDDKIVLPDGTNVKVTMVTVMNDEVGPHHTVVRYGRG